MASAWRAAFKSHDANGILYVNTIGVKMDPISGGGLNPTDLAQAVSDWLTTSYRKCLPTRLTLDTVQVDSFPVSGTQGVHAIGLAGTGVENMDAPVECCVIAAWKTDVATRSGRGHIALPIVWNDGRNTYSTLDIAAYAAAVTGDFFAALAAGHDWASGGVTEGHLSHVVLSKKTGDYYDVKTRLLRSKIRWLERRQTAP